MKTGIQSALALALALGFNGAFSFAIGAQPKPPDDERSAAREAPDAGATALREDEAPFALFRDAARAWREQPLKPAPPEEVNRRRVLAEDAIRNREFEDAILHYERGLKLVPLWPEGQFNVALLYAELGEYGFALIHMRRYLELVPDAADARAAREKMYVWEERAGKPRRPGSGMSSKLKKELADR